MPQTGDSDDTGTRMLEFILKYLEEHEKTMDRLITGVENAENDLSVYLKNLDARLQKITDEIARLERKIDQAKQLAQETEKKTQRS